MRWFTGKHPAFITALLSCGVLAMHSLPSLATEIKDYEVPLGKAADESPFAFDELLGAPDISSPLSEKDIPRNIWEARQRIRVGQFQEAADICERVLKLQSGHVEARACLAAALKGMGEEKKFEKESGTLKKQAPDSPALYLFLADTYLALKDPKQAEASYMVGLKNVSEKTELRMDLAALYHETKRFKQAVDLYLEVLKEKNLTAKYFLNANYALCRIGLENSAYDDVIERARTIVDLYPPIPQGYQFLAAAYLGKGEGNEAAKTYEKLLGVNSNSPVPYQELALIYTDKLNDIPNALHYAKEGVRKFPNDPRSQDVLGWVYYSEKGYAEALKQFQAATRLEQREPFYLYHLGLAQQQMGNKAEAKQAYEQALDLVGGKGATAFAEELKSRIEQVLNK